MSRMLPTQYLLSNAIDKELQDVLFPLTIFQSFFFYSKYIIIGNFITPKNRTSYIKSLIGVVMLLLSYLFEFFYRKKVGENVLSTNNYFMLHLVFDLVIHSIISVIIHVVSEIQTCNAVDIVIKLQQIISSISIDKIQFLSNLKLQNWISIFSLLVVYIGFVIAGVFRYDLTNFLASAALTFCMLIYDLQIVELTRTLVFIANALAVWTRNMEEYMKKDDKSEVNINNNRMMKAYGDIVKSFNLCNKVYAFSITYFGLQWFINVLIHLQIMFEFEKLEGHTVNFHNMRARLLITSWSLKNIILLSILSVTCESFYRGVRSAECTCLQMLVDEQCADMHRTCKNVLRMNGAIFRKLSAFGIFELDAAFPVRLLSGLVPYIVVLLQFALL